MPIRNIVLRVCAILFACAISVADGNATVRQAIANGWTEDAVYIIICAVAFANAGPTFTAAAWGWGQRSIACILACAFLLGASVSSTLTLQRIGAQIDRQQHEVAKLNYPIVLAERDLRDARRDAANIPGQLNAARTQHKTAIARMDAAINDPEAPGKGPKYRKALADRDKFATNTIELEAAVKISVAKINELQQRLKALGPPKMSDFDGLGWLIAAGAALLAPVVSIGLFLFAASVPNARTRNATQDHATRLDVAQHDTALHQPSVAGGVKGCATSDIQPDETPISIETLNIDPSTSSGVDLRCVEPEMQINSLPPKGTPAYREACLRDIIAAGDKYGRLPTHTQIQHRYRVSSTTASSYVRAAAQRWSEHRQAIH